MNVDLACWYADDCLKYPLEYPSDYIPLKSYGRICRDEYSKTTSLQLSVERSGDIISYIFFKRLNTRVYVGINLYINGLVYTNLDKLAELFAPKVDNLQHILSREGNTVTVEASIEPLFNQLRSALSSSSIYKTKPLSPMDYSLSTGYYRFYYWGSSTANEIIQSSEKGETYILGLCPNCEALVYSEVPDDSETSNDREVPNEKPKKRDKKGSDALVPLVVILVSIALGLLRAWIET
ncbi:hypothetical protein [Porphyromonas uenonis]|uniref:Uncharacterized protein n=1 Tax=Porphyromonas uenonis 60-3 TaxID=596327 RepID=C2MD52_9PORP|nr:hypothetical protein [Porphyromonas uenonis]EEK16372.1 hypothetical protein PORUE0001_0373 [Porphyromonas uenonis 60-3]